MQVDTVKLLSSHIVAVVACIGGPILVVWVFLNASTIEGASGLIALLSGFVGLSFQFLYQTNTTAATRGQVRNDLQATTGVQT